MGIMKEFKEFAVKGNVVVAAGIIISAAIGKSVSSFVADVLMPPIGFSQGVSISIIWRSPFSKPPARRL